MSVEALIILLLVILGILAVAWVVEYCVARALAPDPVPQPARIIIWAVAALLVILWSLRTFGVLRIGFVETLRLTGFA